MGRAIVIGASMAGLSTARVLSERFESVLLLDRDTLPADNSPRRGVPQSAHGHILLVSGLQALEGLFSGLEKELVETGGTRFDPGLGLRTFRFGRVQTPVPTGFDLVSMSRPHLELLVRERVTALPRVTVREGVAVSGLLGTDGRITGVTLDTGETLDADLVADCTGRGGRSDSWLAALGLPAPDRLEIKVGVAYATRIHRRRDGDLGDGWQALFTVPTAPRERMAGLALPIEGDRWLLSLGGWHIEHPPADSAAFEAGAAALPDPGLADLIARTEPLTEPVVQRFPASRWRRFDLMASPPAGYFAVGDAFCSFNPIYGQGMTCAAKAAVALGEVVDAGGTPADFYRAAAQIVATPWRFAVGGDFNYPETVGPRPRGIRFRNWYARKIALAAQMRPDINRIWVGVQQLVLPVEELTRPAFAARVLWLTRASRVPSR